jgi:hypothetical protein
LPCLFERRCFTALANLLMCKSIEKGGRGDCNVDLMRRFSTVLPLSLPVKKTFRPISRLKQSMDALMVSIDHGVQDGVGMNFIPMPITDIAAAGSNLPPARPWNVLLVKREK